MLYQRSQQIEQRILSVLRLIRRGSYSTPKLAERLGVSIPTVSRYVTALRERGYDIRAEKQATGWRYVLAHKPAGNMEPVPVAFGQSRSWQDE